MKYLLGTITTLIIILSFAGGDCKHVFTEVEQATIKIESLSLGGSVYEQFGWPYGKQEGKELICVKCFHRQRQVFDYGEALIGQSLTEIPCRGLKYNDTCLVIKNGIPVFDTVPK